MSAYMTGGATPARTERIGRDQIQVTGDAGRDFVAAWIDAVAGALDRSEERRVGKECRSRWSPYH